MTMRVSDALMRLLSNPKLTINTVYPNSPITTDGIPARHCRAINMMLFIF